MNKTRPSRQQLRDRELVEKARSGSTTAFSALVDRHYNDVLYYVLSKGHTREQAYDLVQETFMDAYRALGSISTERPFRAWLFVTAQNNVRHRRRQRRFRQILSLDRLIDKDQCPLGSSTTDDPSSQVVEQETLHVILQELTPNLREPLCLVGAGYSIREIADELNIDYPAARQRVSRAMRYLRNRYEELEL